VNIQPPWTYFLEDRNILRQRRERRGQRRGVPTIRRTSENIEGKRKTGNVRTEGSPYSVSVKTVPFILREERGLTASRRSCEDSQQVRGGGFKGKQSKSSRRNRLDFAANASRQSQKKRKKKGAKTGGYEKGQGHAAFTQLDMRNKFWMKREGLWRFGQN